MQVSYRINGQEYKTWKQAGKICRAEYPDYITRITRAREYTMDAKNYPDTWINKQLEALMLSGCIFTANSALTQVFFPIEAIRQLSAEELIIAEKMILEQRKSKRMDHPKSDAIDITKEYKQLFCEGDKFTHVEDLYSFRAVEMDNYFEAREYVEPLGQSSRSLILHELISVGRDASGEPYDFGEQYEYRVFWEGQNGRREQLTEKEISAESICLSDHPDIDKLPEPNYTYTMQAGDSAYFCDEALTYTPSPAKGFRFEKTESLKEDIMQRLEDGIRPLFETERYREYLKTAAQFHEYSYNNTILIWLQCPEAQKVAGFHKWKELGRAVNKGERGLKIIATGEKKYKDKDKNGNEVEESRRYFFPVTVFDISQTSGKDIVLNPFEIHRLDGTFERYEQCRDALISVAGCPVLFETDPHGADGYWKRSTNEIHVKDTLSQQATLATLVHEITHSRLHADIDELKAREAGQRTLEVEAESVSFVVCERMGLDTSADSFGYIAAWSKDKDLPELKKSLEIITKESNKLSGDILGALEGKDIKQSREKATCQKR